MKSVVMVFAIFLVPFTGYGATINSIHVNEHNIIRVDGDAADWNKYNLDTIPLHVAQYTDSASVSCTIMSLSDIDNVYFFFDVRDDVVVYGEEMYGNAFWDDSVMVLFPQNRLGLPRQMIWVTDNDTGSIIEYHDNSGYYYPSLWEALGVKASYNINETGYTVELSIPHALLEETIEENAFSTVIETGVCDDDDGEDYDSVLMMTGMFWGISSMEFSTFRYELESNDASGLIVNNTLTDQQKAIHSILYDIADNNFLSAIEKTREVGTPWSLPMRAFLCSRYGYIDESIEAYEQAVTQTDDQRVRWLGLFRLIELYQATGHVNELATLYIDNRNSRNWILSGFSTIGDMRPVSGELVPTITDEMYAYCEKHLNPAVIKDLGIIHDAMTNMSALSKKKEVGKYYEIALSKSTKSWVTSDILQQLITFYTKIQDYNNAQICIEKKIAAFGNDDAKTIADQYYRIRKFDTALVYYFQALHNNPNLDIIPKVYKCYLGEEKLDEAVSFFTGIYDQITDENAKVYLYAEFADCLRTNSYYNEAMSMYEDMVDDDIPDPIKERAIIGIADIYFNRKEYDKLEQIVGKIKNSDCSPGTKMQAEIYLNSVPNIMTN